jgi:hypothetical protein
LDPKGLGSCIYFPRFFRYSKVGAFLEKHIFFLTKRGCLSERAQNSEKELAVEETVEALSAVDSALEDIVSGLTRLQDELLPELIARSDEAKGAED